MLLILKIPFGLGGYRAKLNDGVNEYLPMMTDCMEYSNHLVAAADPTFASEKVWKYDWFDLNNGALLKSTEQAIPDGITTFGGDFVVLDNSLWICRYFCQNIENDVKASLNSGDMIMVKVPEQ